MAQLYSFGILVLVSMFLEAASRPSNNDSPTTEEASNIYNNEKSPSYEMERYTDVDKENTNDILDKIKNINRGLKKPQKQQINFNSPQPHTGGVYVLDKDTLDKIKQIIASGKLHGLSGLKTQQENNYVDIDTKYGYSRAFRAPFAQSPITSNSLGGNSAVRLLPFLYSANIPFGLAQGMSFGELSMDDMSQQITGYQPYQTRQRPSLPFNIPWPLAPFFPILVKDPLLTYLQGGNWQNIFEYGQNADVCNRKQKSSDEDENVGVNTFATQALFDNEEAKDEINKEKVVTLRKGRTIKKRTISKTALHQNIEKPKKSTKFFTKPGTTTTHKPIRKTEEEYIDTKATDPNEGDLRFPFSDFTWFGNRKPVAPSPGFFINRLKVRRGGVAIAGPGGVATAGRGGTAVVGPGGLAYTQPGGLAVAGPAAKVVALSSEADLLSIVKRLQQQSAIDSSVPRLLQAIPEGKVVATGPVIYYHPQ